MKEEYLKILGIITLVIILSWGGKMLMNSLPKPPADNAIQIAISRNINR